MVKKAKDRPNHHQLTSVVKEEAAMAEISKEEFAERSKTAAKLYTTPDVNAGSLITAIKNSNYAGSFMHQLRYGEEKGVKLEHVLEEVIDGNNKVLSGNSQEIESFLINQAKALDAVFYRYMGKTLSAKHMNQVQIFAQLAFKAQNQCRNTLATLKEIKNPKQTTFVKQQNNAAVQQVNNVEKVEVKNSEISENFEKSANELLEVKNNEWLDTRAQSKTITINPEMAAMAKSRSKD